MAIWFGGDDQSGAGTGGTAGDPDVEAQEEYEESQGWNDETPPNDDPSWTDYVGCTYIPFLGLVGNCSDEQMEYFESGGAEQETTTPPPSNNNDPLNSSSWWGGNKLALVGGFALIFGVVLLK